MPTKVKERALYSPGNLVATTKDIYSVDPHHRINEGTVGIILSGPVDGYRNHCQVHFVSLAEPWWVNFSEIKPYIEGQ